MRKNYFVICILLIFLAETAVLAVFMRGGGDFRQNTVAVNEILKSVEINWPHPDGQTASMLYDYVILDESGNVLWKTAEGLSESVNAAIAHRDTILDVERDGNVVGKVIIHNGAEADYAAQKQSLAVGLAVILLIQMIVLLGYTAWLHRRLVRPFHKLKDFARRVAGGNLDIPLEMDRRNLFGAFTESFDLMRSELKKARLAEAQANAGKKELVAKLSHDIKTPVASIKAASEVGMALTDSDRLKDNYTQIIRKADQINALITNLFTATLEELQQLSVTLADMESGELAELLENADYLHRSALPTIPPCLLCVDKLRLQQVLDNIFANSYKYADTEIVVTITKESRCLVLAIEDFGGGVPDEELSLLKEKFRRGSNVGDREGAGLGLFISDYFMKEMKGELRVENGAGGLRVSVRIPFS
ncbi:MAG: HAMP domain-containing histidine kinase [Lachnospiraceae bacterium]|nr:HAMP domain-containing histidine kinase [Lachnospiraceae bacterium]